MTHYSSMRTRDSYGARDNLTSVDRFGCWLTRRALLKGIQRFRHNMYYTKKALWLLLIKSGFLTSKIKLRHVKCDLHVLTRARK
jgi:hypothetical protein